MLSSILRQQTSGLFSQLRCVAGEGVSAARAFSSTSAALQEAARTSGVTKWFSNQKGYGFITPDEEGEDLFVHHSSIIVEDNHFRSLREGEPVEFVVDRPQGPDGRAQAVEVTGPGGAMPLGAHPRRFDGGGSRFDGGGGGGRGYGGGGGGRGRGRRDDDDEY